MTLPRGSARILLAGALLLGSWACSGAAQSPKDGAAEYVSPDSPIGSDAAIMPLALDFSATGCSKFDSTAPSCDGTAPLTLTFTPNARRRIRTP